MAMSSFPKVPYLDLFPSDHLEKFTKGYKLLLTHCWKTPPTANSDESTAMRMGAFVLGFPSIVELAMLSLTVKNTLPPLSS